MNKGCEVFCIILGLLYIYKILLIVFQNIFKFGLKNIKWQLIRYILMKKILYDINKII